MSHLKSARSPLLPTGLLLCVLLLTGCQGSGLENLFAADSNAKQWGAPPSASPNPHGPTLPPDLRFPNATLLDTQTLGDEPSTIQTRWQAAAPAIAIQQFYSERFQQDNWRLVEQQVADGSITLKGVGADVEVTVTINTAATNNTTEFTVVYRPTPTPSGSPPTPLPTPALSPQTFSDLDAAPVLFQPAIRELAELGTLPTANNQLEPNRPIRRSQFVRWLVTTYNRFYEDRPARQIRLDIKNDEPIFQDVPRQHPDFVYIQGLAMAGFLPSPLTGEASALFRPDAPLNRETLLQWKVPLDHQGRLSPSSIDRIQQTWGFKDSTRITPSAVSAVAADYLAGDLSNIRRVWGRTLLLQPQKAVSHAEAAMALWYIGNGSEGLSAQTVLQARRK